MDEQNEGELVYLIEKIWTDSMENECSAAVGYEPSGYTRDEDVAKRICDTGRQYSKKDCWAIIKTMPEFRYMPLKELK